MAVQLISYDLRAPGRDYSSLYSAIKQYASWWHCLESTWMVFTNEGSDQVRDRLRPHIDGNDLLLVVAVGSNWATAGPFGADCLDWLRNNVAA